MVNSSLHAIDLCTQPVSAHTCRQISKIKPRTVYANQLSAQNKWINAHFWTHGTHACVCLCVNCHIRFPDDGTAMRDACYTLHTTHICIGNGQATHGSRLRFSLYFGITKFRMRCPDKAAYFPNNTYHSSELPTDGFHLRLFHSASITNKQKCIFNAMHKHINISLDLIGVCMCECECVCVSRSRKRS